MSNDVIQRMDAAYVDAINKHRAAFDDAPQFDERGAQQAMRAAVRVLLEALHAFNVKTSDGKPRQWLGSEAELNGALLNDFERQIGLTAPTADAPRVTVAATGWDADGENRD